MSDNIYSAFFPRFSIDTLYVGLKIDAFEFPRVCEQIKNYLFFKHELKENLTSSRSRFYRMEYTCEKHGFYMFFSPRANLRNDYCTIQLGGKFFKNIDFSYYFVTLLLESFGNLINFQRVDVALDVCYEKAVVWDCDLSHNWGFPFPDYNEHWANRKIPFEIFGRFLNGQWFINQVSHGKNDLVLRVYDKSLELREKYHVNYSDYYQIEKEFLKVFRIEFQMRSDKLKDFVSSCSDKGFSWDSYDEIVNNVMCYVFTKFSFLGLDEISFDFEMFECNVSPNHKHKSTLENRIAYHKKMQNCHFQEYCNLVEEKKNIEESKKYLKKILILEKTQELNDLYEPLESVFEFDKSLKVKMDLYDAMSKTGL